MRKNERYEQIQTLCMNIVVNNKGDAKFPPTMPYETMTMAKCDFC